MSVTHIRTSRNAACTSCSQILAVKLQMEWWNYMMTHPGGSSETTRKQSWETAHHQKLLSCPLLMVSLSKLTRMPEMVKWFWRYEPGIFSGLLTSEEIYFLFLNKHLSHKFGFFKGRQLNLGLLYFQHFISSALFHLSLQDSSETHVRSF